jgi:hypothetical protein
MKNGIFGAALAFMLGAALLTAGPLELRQAFSQPVMPAQANGPGFPSLEQGVPFEVSVFLVQDGTDPLSAERLADFHAIAQDYDFAEYVLSDTAKEPDYADHIDGGTNGFVSANWLNAQKGPFVLVVQMNDAGAFLAFKIPCAHGKIDYFRLTNYLQSLSHLRQA